MIEHLQLIFIELPKFPAHSSEEKEMRLLWLRFLREINEKTQAVSADLLAVPDIAQAVSLAEQSAYTPAELDAYQSYWDSVSAEKTLLSGAFKDGRAAGFAEGEAKGKAEAKAEMVKAMLASNLSMTEIITYSGLSETDILAIKQQ